MGEYQPPKIFSVDVSPNGKTIVAVAQGNRGGRELYIYQKHKLKKLIDWKKNIPAYKVRFVNNNRVILGLSGDEIILYDIRKKKKIYRKYIGMSFFSDMEINEKRTKLALTDESGDTRIVDVKTGKIVKVIEELNKDKSFDIDFRNNRILNGSRDKKAVLYNLKTNKYRIMHADDFMVFSVGLSPSGKRGAYLYNNRYDIKVFNTKTGSSIAMLKGHKATPSLIKFINENRIITGCDDGKLFFWKITK
jgi:WD40 repeat protein